MGNSCLQCVTISCSRILRFSLPGSQYEFVSESCSEETSVKPQDWFHILNVVFCFVMKVSAYGFMTPDYNNYSDHYFDSSYHPVGFYVNHDLRMEMNLWQQLHQAGLLRLYQRQGQQ